jgi:hypothetical protein
MRHLIERIVAACAVTSLLALSVVAFGSGAPGAAASSSHALTVPALVSASNWSVMSNAVTTGSSSQQYSSRVSCVTSVFCMSVGDSSAESGTAFAQQWNGTMWSQPLPLPPVPSAQATDLTGVSCVTTSFCVAVGFAEFSGSPSNLIEQWTGGQWIVVVDSAATSGSLLGVSCVTLSFCVASGVSGGGTATAVMWNGSGWTSTPISLPSGDNETFPFNVSCTTPSTCMMVGWAETATNTLPWAASWNGTTWTNTSVPVGSDPFGQLASVSCAGLSYCVAVGPATTAGSANVNLVETWNGSSWTQTSVPQPGDSGTSLLDVSCFSATSCTAVGSSATNSGNTTSSEVLTWNGQTWTQPASPNVSGASTTQLTGVDCLTNWSCVTTGFSSDGTNDTPFNIVAPIARSGYRFVATDGGIFNYGPGAPFLGSMGGQPLNKPIVAMATMPAGDGYYLVASDGGVFNFGSAQFYGSAGSLHLNSPVVGMAVTEDGGGYWLVAADGGIFSYGDAQFYGSMGGMPLNKPIVGMAAVPNGDGYYLVASDGGIFTFPTGPQGPPFLGSAGSIKLNKPMVGMAVTSAGQYYTVATDGGVFSYPDVPGGPPFYGSTGSIKLNQPIVGMTLTNEDAGYYLGASDGGIFSFPDNPSGPTFYGSRGGQPLNAPVVGIAG